MLEILPFSSIIFIFNHFLYSQFYRNFMAILCKVSQFHRNFIIVSSGVQLDRAQTELKSFLKDNSKMLDEVSFCFLEA